MSKIVDKYNELKNIDKDKLYLFESGIFYIFVNEDAKIINKKLYLKITQQGNYFKCGFPIRSKEKYFELLKDKKINYEIIELEKQNSRTKNEKQILKIETISLNNKSIEKEIIRKLKSINVEYYNPIEALNFLKELKEIVK